MRGAVFALFVVSGAATLCARMPVGPVTCKETRQLQGLPAAVLVEQLRQLPTPLPSGPRPSDAERRRASIYEELLDWGPRSVPPLAAALNDPDVHLRRNAALALEVLGGGWWVFECGTARIDVLAALPAMVKALRDADSDVRAWSAQAIAGIGPNAADAVPALVELLKNDNEGSRSSACIALARIGPAARAALPALRAALADGSPDVRRFAAHAIQRIEQSRHRCAGERGAAPVSFVPDRESR
jgi:hypothetical protein